jgi:putative ABC transport system ATP-binding protein
MIQLRKVSRFFQRGQQRVCALQDVDLDVANGEFVTIMGPSGSGKSSMLHIIGGLDIPSSGEVYIDGCRVAAMNDTETTVFRRRKIGFVFQFFNLLPTLTAEENVALPLLLDGKRMADVRPWVARLLTLVGLAERLDHTPDELSGGEMQRVAIARALVAEPAVVLADEPTGNLDSETGQEILALMRRTCRELAQTVVLVTHDRLAAAYSDRLITLRDGRITEDLDLRFEQSAAAVSCREVSQQAALARPASGDRTRIASGRATDIRSSSAGALPGTLVAEGPAMTSHESTGREGVVTPVTGPQTDQLVDVARLVGFALLLGGVICTVVAVLAHLAWALPISELPRRPALLPGVLFGSAGLVLAAMGSRRRADRDRPSGVAGRRLRADVHLRRERLSKPVE